MRKFALSFATILAFALLTYAPAASAQSAAAPKPSAPPDAKPQGSAPPPAAQPPSPFKDQKEKLSYALGMNLGENLKRASVDVDPAEILKGMNDVLAGKPLMTEDEFRATMIQMQADLKTKQEEKARMAAVNNKKEGDAFLEANKSQQGVVVLPSGLQYKILTQGTGPTPTATDTVSCNYRGTLINGTEFDSSFKRGQPAQFRVGGVIRGWTEALQLMPVGSKWQLFIPPTLAYADRGAGPDIGPNATLIFEVELLSIQPKPEVPKPEAPKPQGAPKP
ncbi:MAG TPA: FKBP-type peptidyl-prolyl cis-trans isomerase [Candidatus Acidoferrales bacterium]|nr:FKBP-type peptidyl-prolyl cis-trans isomerase [Candidatus Acidoferrales bacterium]